MSFQNPNIAPQIPSPRTLDAACYRDAAKYQRELKVLFMAAWMPACSSKELENAGGRLVWDRLRQSVVIARVPNGTLSAWHNVCRHRGAQLAKESGQGKSAKFKRPSHGFSHDLSGKCNCEPLRECFDGAGLVGLCAPLVRVEEWNGLVWLNFCVQAPTLRDYLGELWTQLGLYSANGFEIRYHHSTELNANWKVVINAFAETWHVPFTHHQTLSGLMLWREARLHICPPHSWMTLPIANFTADAGPQTNHHEANVRHYTAFPNTIFSCFPAHLQIWSVWPISQQRTLLTAWGAAGPAPAGLSEEKWSEQSDRSWGHFLDALSEDSQALNDLGATARSCRFERGLVNPAEGRLTVFQHEVMRRVGPR